MEQMDNLDNLHKETVETRTKKEAAKTKRDAQLAARLKKVRDRKRLKMGLPVKPDDEEEVNVDVQPEEKEVKIEDSVMENLRTLRQVEEDRMRKNIVREWDVGKDGVSGQATNQEAGVRHQLPETGQLLIGGIWSSRLDGDRQVT